MRAILIQDYEEHNVDVDTIPLVDDAVDFGNHWYRVRALSLEPSETRLYVSPEQASDRPPVRVVTATVARDR